MPGTLRYLAYGSNLHPLRLARRTASARPIGTTQLPGWTLHFNKYSRVDGSGKCHILRSDNPASVIHAAVYELSPEDKPALDRIEGLGHGYREHTLHTEAFGEVFLYLAEPAAITEPVRPFVWYRQLVAAGARYQRFPDTYVRKIETTPAADDPDAERRREHRELLNILNEADPCAT